MKNTDLSQTHRVDEDLQKLSDEERRDALRSIAKFSTITGPAILTLLASEQAVASGGTDPECGKLPVC